MRILNRVKLSMMAAICVVVLSIVCNIAGMLLGIPPAPDIPWFGGWIAIAILAGSAVFYASRKWPDFD